MNYSRDQETSSSKEFLENFAENKKEFTLTDSVPFVIINDGNDRKPIPSKNYPYGSVGKVEVLYRDGTEKGCTGFLAGPRFAITNAHCFRSATEEPWLATFTPHAGAEYRANVITTVFGNYDFENPSSVDVSQDWAILIFSWNIGNTLNYILPIEFYPGWFDREVLNVVSYPNDYPDGIFQEGCKAVSPSGRSPTDPVPMTISHTCDVNRGASGSPLFTRRGDDWVVPLMNAAAITPNPSDPSTGDMVCDFSPSCKNLAVNSVSYATTFYNVWEEVCNVADCSN